METATNAGGFYKDRYDRNAPNETVAWFVEEIFKKWIAKNARGRVLDSGCGDGAVTAEIAKRLEVTGIDVSEKNLKVAKKAGLRTVMHDLAKKLPFKAEEFDTAISNQVLEHVYDTDFYLGEIYRVLKKGGVLLITTPNAVSLTDRFRVMFGKLPITCEVSLRYKMGTKEPPNGHIRPYTFPELEYQLRRIGFKIAEERTTNFPFPVYWKVPGILRQLAVMAGKIMPSFGGQIMMKAVK